MYASARICNRLTSLGINSEESRPPAYVAWRAGTTNRVVVPARQAGNRFLVSEKVYKYGLRRGTGTYRLKAAGATLAGSPGSLGGETPAPPPQYFNFWVVAPPSFHHVAPGVPFHRIVTQAGQKVKNNSSAKVSLLFYEKWLTQYLTCEKRISM